MNALQWVLVALTALLTLPVLVLWAQVFAARERAATRAPAQRPRVAVLVPAHNEAGGIEASLRAVREQLRTHDRLLVVADNCNDDTAAVAAAAGAEAVQRRDSERRGKGYALDFGVRHLSADAPQVLVMLDADCIAQPGTIDALVADCVSSARPTQALYLMQAPAGAGLRMRVAQFAWLMKNQVRPLGARRLGGPCQLMGTGMAFAWEQIRSVPLASGHLVEDMKLGIDLALSGHAPLFVPQALVTSRFPDTTDAARSQRTRWEHGHLATLLAEGPRLLLRGVTSGRWQAVALAFDLMVPPLALLLLLHVLLALFNVGIGLALLGWTLPAALSAAAFVLLASAVLRAWWRFGRDTVSLGELALAPLYALWKLPVYAGFLLRRQAEWVRAKRDDE